MFMDSGAKLIVAEWATRYGNDAGIVFGMECGDTRKFVLLNTNTHRVLRSKRLLVVNQKIKYLY